VLELIEVKISRIYALASGVIPSRWSYGVRFFALYPHGPSRVTNGSTGRARDVGSDVEIWKRSSESTYSCEEGKVTSMVKS
jgi:hypothetical protein